MSPRSDPSQLVPDLDGPESETPTPHTAQAAPAAEQERPTETWRISGRPVRVRPQPARRRPREGLTP